MSRDGAHVVWQSELITKCVADDQTTHIDLRCRGIVQFYPASVVIGGVDEHINIGCLNFVDDEVFGMVGIHGDGGYTHYVAGNSTCGDGGGAYG